MKTRIFVSRNNIADGKRESETSCPIALALKECFGAKFTVYWEEIVYGKLIICRMPVAARRFIMKFDSGQPVKPFSFTLPIERFDYIE